MKKKSFRATLITVIGGQFPTQFKIYGPVRVQIFGPCSFRRGFWGVYVFKGVATKKWLYNDTHSRMKRILRYYCVQIGIEMWK